MPHRPNSSLVDGPLSAEDFFLRCNRRADDGQRWSTWSNVQKGCHAHYPRPERVVTEDGAIDTDLGILKTGKEADVFPHRTSGSGRPIVGARQQAVPEHGPPQLPLRCRECRGRRVKRSRDALRRNKAAPPS